MKSLSLVIPVYNAPDLARAAVAAVPDLARTAEACGFKLVEAIFVDDGSEPPLDLSTTGGTRSCASENAVAQERDPPVDCDVPIRILRQPTNCGKGAAVRRGALEATGGWVLMSDVDMSAPFAEFARLAERADAWMVCGSRHGRPGMPFLRRLLSRLFHFCVWCAGVRGVYDTQCGFKLFRMDVMRAVFERQRIARFAFDVELIRNVQVAGGDVVEVPVDWRGGERSSLRVFRDAPRMLWDLFRL
ncbi:MAG: glycosyltransferase [Kiritimatiellae bacterium]|nr:glycosyltransferase [Kiritimatiellia bacterium]